MNLNMHHVKRCIENTGSLSCRMINGQMGVALRSLLSQRCINDEALSNVLKICDTASGHMLASYQLVAELHFLEVMSRVGAKARGPMDLRSVETPTLV